MTTTDRKKKKKLRHLEYYSNQEILDKLYEKSSQGKEFHNIFKYVIDKNNILLAYRNIKRNNGSKTQGTDGKTIKNYENLETNYLRGIPVFHLGCIKFKAPQVFNPKISNYTEEGREMINDKLSAIDIGVMKDILENPIQGRSVEYNDNRLSVYSAQYGRCALTGEALAVGDMVCYNKNPIEKSGSDHYNNLIYLCDAVHQLIISSDTEDYEERIKNLRLNDKQLAMIEKLRKIAER